MTRIVTIALICLFTVAQALAGDSEQDQDRNKDQPKESPPQVLDEGEVKDLKYLREEEKLARDVYRALLAKWNLQMFTNISQAEQRHMGALGGLLEKYGIKDPVGDNAAGVFSNSDLQALYKSLTKKGRKSRTEALIVGATIEDLDIHDLLENIKRTEKPDLLVVYQNLLKGSRNHLRAFARQLAQAEVTYVPQHITQEMFDKIVNSPTERGRVDAEGKPAGGGKGRRHRGRHRGGGGGRGGRR